MAVTAKGTPYVESSDLVANYPGVSLALANHIDSRVGLVLVANSTFSTAGVININNCFTSLYRNYSVVLELTGNGALAVRGRLRVGGVDASGASDYKTGWSVVTGTSVVDDSFYSSNGTSSGFMNHVNSSGVFTGTTHTFYAPQIAQPTLMSGFLASDQFMQGTMGFSHGLSTAYDGLTIFPSANTMTGSIRIYGYQNS